MIGVKQISILFQYLKKKLRMITKNFSSYSFDYLREHVNSFWKNSSGGTCSSNLLHSNYVQNKLFKKFQVFIKNEHYNLENCEQMTQYLRFLIHTCKDLLGILCTVNVYLMLHQILLRPAIKEKKPLQQ